MPEPLTLADLAAEGAASHAALAARPGQARGSVLGPWAENLNRRYGPDAAAAIRAQLGVDLATLPDAPLAEQWISGALQIATTDAIIATHYADDLLGLEAPLIEDVGRKVGRMARVMLRGLGPARLLSKAEKLHSYTWDIGAVSTTVTANSATLVVHGSPLFTYRTWLALQLMALRGAVELTGRTVQSRHVMRLAEDRAQLYVRWR